MRSDPPVLLVFVLSAVMAVGCAAMAVAHAGITVPLLSRFGPGGSDPVPPAVVVFTLGTMVLGVLAYGTARRRAWAWAGGIAVHGLVVLGALTPYRGVGSLVAVALSGAAAVILVSRSGRAALLPAR